MSPASPAHFSPAAARPGVVYLVGGGPGDPGLLTVRGAELLGSADVVLHDELVHPALLDLARPDAEVRSVGKRGGDGRTKQASQAAIEAELTELGRAGKSVVRLKGGDPFLFGRGSEEAEALVAAGVPFEVVPGIPSPFGATAYAGISVTHRDLASSVTIVSATTRDGADFDFTKLAGVTGTLTVLMGMRKLDELCARIARDAGRDPGTPAAVIQWGTRPDQRVVTGRLDAVADRAREAGLGSPAVVVVGPVVELREALRWFDARPLFGKRVLVTRASGQAGGTAALLRRRGAEPVALPTIEIEEPPEPARVTAAARGLGAYDAVAFTSENGVARFFAELERLGLDARAFGKARVAAIGSGTAAALRTRGIKADVVPKDFHGEGLAEALIHDPIFASALAFGAAGEGTARVLVPRAKVAREVFPDTLRAAGARVDVVPVYETRPASRERREELIGRLEAGAVDVVLLTSSSTAESLVDLLGDRAAGLLSKALVASIGPITTRSAEARGLTVGVTAGISTIEGLVDAVERHLTAR